MQVVPLQPIPNQTLQVQLAGQACTINVYQQAYGLYVDILVGTTPIVQGIIGLNGNLIVRDTYFGFSGDLEFLDTTDNSDPVYTGFGTRWFLVYLSPSDIAAGRHKRNS
jgi:hypothetical protein